MYIIHYKDWIPVHAYLLEDVMETFLNDVALIPRCIGLERLLKKVGSVLNQLMIWLRMH
jgi:hypothetical protein